MASDIIRNSALILSFKEWVLTWQGGVAPPEAVPSTESGPGDPQPWLCDFQVQNSWKAEEKAIFFWGICRGIQQFFGSGTIHLFWGWTFSNSSMPTCGPKYRININQYRA
jgi:hypothetical protein